MVDSHTDTGDSTNDTNAESSAGETAHTAPREALVTTAVNFLLNAKVQSTTLSQKQKFLRSKGLTVQEIQIACERAGVYTLDSDNPQKSNVINMETQLTLQTKKNALARFKEILGSVSLLGGLVYAIYMFWKKFIVRFLYGEKKRPPIDEILVNIEKNVSCINDVGRELTQLRDVLTQQQHEQAQHVNRAIKSIHSDLEALKGLLLNRKQFAAPTSNVGRASVPAWQLAASSTSHHHRHHSQSDDNEKHDDAGSGSGSSETEVVTKNSDSSLEIM